MSKAIKRDLENLRRERESLEEELPREMPYSYWAIRTQQLMLSSDEPMHFEMSSNSGDFGEVVELRRGEQLQPIQGTPRSEWTCLYCGTRNRADQMSCGQGWAIGCGAPKGKNI